MNYRHLSQPPTPLEARIAFEYRAKWLAGRLFVNIAAYIDETGTHDPTGARPGSEMAGLCGLVAWREEWALFCEQWQQVLNKYSADYFHYCEWSQAMKVAKGERKEKRGSKPKPYAGWSIAKLDDFVCELTDIAGDGNKVAVGGLVNVASIYKATSKIPNRELDPSGGDPYLHLIREFFKNIAGEIQSVWPHWKEPITLHFDQNDDKKWACSILAEFSEHKKKDPRFAEICFVDKKFMPHLPMQAADLFAYRFRQISSNIHNGKIPKTLNKLDSLMFRGMFKQFDSGRW
jgi:hypothetical protein